MNENREERKEAIIMKTNTMASLSTTICALVLVSAAAVSVSAISLQEICTQTRTPRFCYALLNGHALDNLRQLDESVIVATTDSASKTSAKIQSLLSQSTYPNLKVVYSLCSNYYSAALAALSAAREKIRSGDFGSVRSAADTAANDGNACRIAFSMAPTSPIAILGENDEFMNYCSVFVVLSQKL